MEGRKEGKKVGRKIGRKVGRKDRIGRKGAREESKKGEKQP